MSSAAAPFASFVSSEAAAQDHALLSRLSAAQGKHTVDQALTFTAEDPHSTTRGPGGVNVSVDAAGLEKLRRAAARTAMSLRGTVAV